MPKLDALACAELIDALTSIGAAASEAIQGARCDDVRIKPDGSPVTAADEAAEAVIRNGLACLAPGVPIISEERWSQEKSKPAPEGSSYFLVDPLDGTREFIAGNDEYTVNIAVVTDGLPILGVIMAPALGLLWRGIVGRGAEKMNADDGSSPTAIHTRKRPGKPVIMVSRSHLEARTTGLSRRPAGQRASGVRIVDKILPPRRRLGRHLSTACAHPRLGHRGGPRHPQISRR